MCHRTGAYGPATGRVLERVHRSVVQELAVASAEPAQIPVVQGVDLDIVGVGFEQCACDVFLAQHRTEAARFNRAQRPGRGSDIGQCGELPQRFELRGGCDVQATARVSERTLA